MRRHDCSLRVGSPARSCTAQGSVELRLFEGPPLYDPIASTRSGYLFLSHELGFVRHWYDGTWPEGMTVTRSSLTDGARRRNVTDGRRRMAGAAFRGEPAASAGRGVPDAGDAERGRRSR